MFGGQSAHIWTHLEPIFCLDSNRDIRRYHSSLVCMDVAGIEDTVVIYNNLILAADED